MSQAITVLYGLSGASCRYQLAEHVADAILRAKSVVYIVIDQEVERATYLVYSRLKDSAAWSSRMEDQVELTVKGMPIGACTLDHLHELIRSQTIRPDVLAIDYATLLDLGLRHPDPLKVQNELLDFAISAKVEIITYIPANRRPGSYLDLEAG